MEARQIHPPAISSHSGMLPECLSRMSCVSIYILSIDYLSILLSIYIYNATQLSAVCLLRDGETFHFLHRSAIGHWSCHGCENMLQGLPATHTHTMPMFCGINQLLWHLLAFRLSTLTALGSTRIALAWLVVVHCGVPNGVRSTCPAMH